MKSVFPWYVYGLLGLLFAGIGVSGLVQGQIFPSGFYVIGGMLIFGVALMGDKRKKGEKTGYQAIEKLVDPDLIALLAEAKKTEAVRKYRLFTGCDLKEAKEHIESLERLIAAEAEETKVE